MRLYLGDNILVTPDALARFAWSAPMRDLALKVGISDVGLKKLLRGFGIPTPPQGHWNRVHAGRPVSGPPEAGPRGPGETGRIVLDRRFRSLVEESEPMPVDGPFASTTVPEDLDALRQQELKAIGHVGIPRDLTTPHVGLVRLLKKEEAKRREAVEKEWYWNKPAFDTPLGQRQLKLLNALFLALARRGHAGGAKDDNGNLAIECYIGGRTLRLSFSVVGKHPTRLVMGRHLPASDLPASTPLRLTIDHEFRSNVKSSWHDEPEDRLERKLATIAADIIVAGEAAFRQGLLEVQEWEQQRRRWEEERKREERAALEAKRLKDLRRSGELLAEAEEIRRLVARLKAAMVTRGSEMDSGTVERWERWALAHADQLDPVLSGQVLSHLFVPELDEA